MQRQHARKLARQGARRKERRRHQTQAGQSRFAYLGVTRSELERAPIHKTLVSDGIFTQGIGNVIVSRFLPDGRVAAGLFLVDSGCLGVKDAFFTVLSPGEFDDRFAVGLPGQNLESKPPAFARKLIEDSVAYARSIGIEPTQDYDEASVVLGDIDAAGCSETFTFGKDGKPFYVSGPNDTEERSRFIIATLKSHCGEGGFDYLVEVSDPEQDSELGGPE